MDQESQEDTGQNDPAGSVPASVVDEEEEEDVFQCGKCKNQFSSLKAFMAHKRQPCRPRVVAVGVTSGGLDAAPPISVCQASIISEDQASVTSVPHIVLSETDFLTLPTLDSLAETVPIQALGGATTSYLGSSLLPCVSVAHHHHPLLSSIISSQPLTLQVGVGTHQSTILSLTPCPAVTSTATVSPSCTGADDANGSDGLNDAGTTLTYSLVAEIPVAGDVPSESEASMQVEATAEDCDDGVEGEEQSSEQKEAATAAAKIAKGRRGRLPYYMEKVSQKCMFCAKVFAKNFDLQQHLRSHTGEKPFQCIVCGRAFAQKSNVKKHMATHKVWPKGLPATLPKVPITVSARKSPVPASILSDRVERPKQTEAKPTVVASPTKKENDGLEPGACEEEADSLEIHIDKSFLCQYCSATFTSYCKLKTHLKDHKNQQVYRCVMPNCGKTFPQLDDFLIHTNTHENEMNYRCHVCSKQFATLYDLGVHQYTHTLHPNQVAKAVPRFYRCTQCRSKYSTPEALEHHLATSTHNFPCRHCDKVFPCERYLRRHLPSHGSLITHTCHVCNKTFKNENYVRMHLLIHSGDKPFPCNQCGARFNRKDKLKRHSLIHQTVKRFKCPFRSYLGCKKEFHRPDKLKAHILSHSGVRPYQCHKCNRAFSRPANLKEHLQMHNDDDEFNFHCQQCYQGFKDEESQKDHVCQEPSSPAPPEVTKPKGRRPSRIKGRPRDPPTVTTTTTKKRQTSVVKRKTTGPSRRGAAISATTTTTNTAAMAAQRRSMRARKPKAMPDYEQPNVAVGRNRASSAANESAASSVPVNVLCEPDSCIVDLAEESELEDGADECVPVKEASVNS